MKSLPLIVLGLAAVAVAAPFQKASIGVVSPNWSVTDSTGKTQSVDSYRGKFVVLEWTNKDCPYVRRHYGSGNMQATQEKAREMGAVWLTVNSSAEGYQGYLSPAETNQYRAEMKVKSNATLLDSDGTIGHIYGAKTTPQIVILDPKGVVIYNGAIDDKPTPDPEANATANNYALAALKEAMAGKPVTVASSRSYGCGIKYAH